MAMWWGLAASAVPVVRASQVSWGWIVLVSPLLTMVLLLFMSGIPTAEGPNQARFMRDPTSAARYLAYRERTSVLWPLPPAVYVRLPLACKRVCCCEFRMYEYDPASQGSGYQPLMAAGS
jgi:hypothetical protein